MSGLARGRLMAERKEFRKNRPFGFVAKPVTKPDGSQDLLEWECLVPGKEGTLFAGASYPITMTFTDSYPETPPYIRLHLIDGKPLCHPNIYPSGKLCLSITNTKEDHGTWMPSTTIRVCIAPAAPPPPCLLACVGHPHCSSRLVPPLLACAGHSTCHTDLARREGGQPQIAGSDRGLRALREEPGRVEEAGQAAGCKALVIQLRLRGRRHSGRVEPTKTKRGACWGSWRACARTSACSPQRCVALPLFGIAPSHHLLSVSWVEDLQLAAKVVGLLHLW